LSSKRHIRRKLQTSGCKGKHPHATEKAARFHSYELYNSGKAKPGTLNTYRCKHCGCYHVGHRRDAPGYGLV
jgi:hypothetical protein